MRYIAERETISARPVGAATRVLNDFGGSEVVDLRAVVAAAAEELAIPLNDGDLETLGDAPMRPSEIAHRVFEFDEAVAEEEAVEDTDAIAVHTIFSAKGLGVDSTRPADFLVDHCRRVGVDLEVIPAGG